MTVVRPADGTLIVRVRPGFIEYVLGFTMLMPLWTYLPGGTRQLGGALLVSAIAGLILSYVAEIGDFTFDSVRGEPRWVRRTAWKWLMRTTMPFEGSVALRDIRVVEVLSAPGSGESPYNLHHVSLTVPGGIVSFARYSPDRPRERERGARGFELSQRARLLSRGARLRSERRPRAHAMNQASDRTAYAGASP